MSSANHYETLDPENWEEMRALAHRSKPEDFDLLAREVVWSGEELVAHLATHRLD